MKLRSFIGSRVIKTGIAVLLTAYICKWIGWSPVFAVITAIVTIEPTVSDSIRKGLIRFPASAIGAAYAVLFIALFGNSPVTYALSAVFTISTCFRLKLHDGLLVATITSVAMVDVIHSNYLMEFFIRLFTTTIGLSVSTLVNMFLLPPDYQKNIQSKVTSIAQELGVLTKDIYHCLLLTDEKSNESKYLNRLLGLDKIIIRAEILSRYQTNDTKYHFTEYNQEKFKDLKTQLHFLRIMHYHITNVIDHPKGRINVNENEKNELMIVSSYIAQVLKKEIAFNSNDIQDKRTRLNELFWKEKHRTHELSEDMLNKLPFELVMLYELISILELTEDYYMTEELNEENVNLN
ncbi:MULTISPECIES: aromatic acid exporter family protein [unclassified Oceanobacillus]|uniref:aromatic acid exporter family protein n=1 Tax=unclassified Oceanobacillus TaxID=2630292 RepID=UPI001BE5D713|nr:FUSC family protein [Oceanobacillus sp. ISL-74]MBT2652372.1 FUSC family protein [Oceanobacillus sp. ISL-73]